MQINGMILGSNSRILTKEGCVTGKRGKIISREVYFCIAEF
jgi:hypothetical protein